MKAQTINFVDTLTVTLPRHVMSQVLAQARECDLTLDEYISALVERQMVVGPAAGRILEGVMTAIEA